MTDGRLPDAPAGTVTVPPHRRDPGRTLAITSFVLGLCGFSLLPLVGCLGAVVTGHLARRRIAETAGDGGGFAVAGLVLGYTGVAIAAALLVLPLGLVLLRSGTG